MLYGNLFHVIELTGSGNGGEFASRSTGELGGGVVDGQGDEKSCQD